MRLRLATSTSSLPDSMGVGFDLPADLHKADPADVIAAFAAEGEGMLNPARKAFVRRAIERASIKKETFTDTVPAPSPAQVSRMDKLAEIFGSQVSAEAVAEALSAKPTQVEVHDLLTKANCSALPSMMLLDVSIWQALAADSEVARKRRKLAFTYVDFTAKVMMPPWLPADAVGGKKKRLDGASELDPDSNTISLQALSSALQSAVAEPRALRSMTQWSSIYWRYAPMAVAVGQLSWSSAIAYHATIMRLAEMERLAKTQGWVAIQYDAALRKSWTRRIQQGDPDLDVPKECCKINDEALGAVRVQLGAGAALVSSSSSSATRPGIATTSAWADAAAEGVLAKVGAAAQSMTRRAEAASRELVRAEQALAAREEAMQGPTVGGAKQGKGGKANAGKGGKAGKGQGGGSYPKKRKWNGKWR